MLSKIISDSLTNRFEEYHKTISNIKKHKLLDRDSADWLLLLLDYDREYDFVSEAANYFFSSDLLTTQEKRDFAFKQLLEMKELYVINNDEFLKIYENIIEKIFKEEL